MQQESNTYLNEWQKIEELAENILALVGKLYRRHAVVTTIYGRALINQSIMYIIDAHRKVERFDEGGLPIEQSFKVLQAIANSPLRPARIDLGKLTTQFIQNKEDDVEAFIQRELGEIINGEDEPREPTDVVLYGFGRIGRLLARLLIKRTGSGENLRLRAIVVRKGGSENDIEKRTNLLRYDSVHGGFSGVVRVDEENQAIIANGNYIQVIYADSPDKVDYTEYGINNAIVIDNTGKWRDEEGLGLHLKSKGVKKVLLTAPGKGDIKNIVYGVNNQLIPDEKILSAASCTTNAIVPVLQVINEKFGIEYGHVETIHAYTNDQNLLDNYHSASRRGRSAPLNMVITETGAAKAVAKVLPELKGKLTGNAIRIPTPNVSLAILNLTLKQDIDKEALNSYLKDIAQHSKLHKQIDFIISNEAVSSDFIGARHAGVVDSQATITQDNHCVLYVWYDNEYGYSCQLVRIIQEMAGIVIADYPKKVTSQESQKPQETVAQ